MKDYKKFANEDYREGFVDGSKEGISAGFAAGRMIGGAEGFERAMGLREIFEKLILKAKRLIGLNHVKWIDVD